MGKNRGFYQNLEKLGMIEKIKLSEEELESILKTGDDELPDDVFWEETELNDTESSSDGNWRQPGPKVRTYWRYPVLPDNEIQNRLAAFNALQLQELLTNARTIKGCIVFFTVIAAIVVSFFVIAFFASSM